MSEEIVEPWSTFFVSMDRAIGGVRAEVEVQKGVGYVTDIEEKGKACKVTVKSNLNARGSSNGWVMSSDPVLEIARQAKANGGLINYRFETSRRKTNLDTDRPIPRTTPINELTGRDKSGKPSMDLVRQNCQKTFAGASFIGEELQLTGNAVTSPLEDSYFTGGNSMAEMTAEEIANMHAQSQTAQANSQPVAFSGHAGFEPAPYRTLRSNGQVNMGSIAVGVPVSVFGFLADYNRDHEAGLSTADLKALTVEILNIANRLQLNAYKGELTEPDLSLGSHSRARHIIFEVIRTFEDKAGVSKATMADTAKWGESVFNIASKMWDWSLEVATPYLGLTEGEEALDDDDF